MRLSTHYHSFSKLPFNNISFFSDLGNLKGFAKLETLILDKNNLRDIEFCPPLSNLHTLWLNNNLIENLHMFMDQVSTKFINLKYLSMMRNPACPGKKGLYLIVVQYGILIISIISILCAVCWFTPLRAHLLVVEWYIMSLLVSAVVVIHACILCVDLLCCVHHIASLSIATINTI